MRTHACGLLCLALLGAGCAAEKVSLASVAAPELIVETLPLGAKVTEGGVERGVTPYVFRAAPDGTSRRISLALPGYHPQDVVITAEEVSAHPGQHVLVPLRPDVWEPNARLIGPDDLGQLGKAGNTLSRANRCPEALQFFKRMLQVDPRTPSAHKGMGICYAKMNKRREALEAYKRYLLYAPDAPDAEKVQAMVSKAEGDIDIPEPKRDE